MPNLDAPDHSLWGMTEEERSIVACFRRQAKDNVRCIVRYSEAAWSILYLRDDVRRRNVLHALEDLIPRVQHDTSGQEDEAYPFTKLISVIRRFDGAVVLTVPQPDHWNLFVVLEPEIGSDVFDLVSHHRDRFDD